MKRNLTMLLFLSIASVAGLQAANLDNGKTIIKKANVDCSSDAKASWEFMFDNAMVSGLEELKGANKDDAKAYCMKYASDGIREEK